MRKKLVSAFSAAALSASVMLVVPSSAWAGSSESEPRVSEKEGGMSTEVWENQDKLFSYGDWLAEQIEPTDLGFIATVNDANNLSVKLLWEEDRLDAAGFYKEEAEARGINVSVIPRKYSLHELESTTEQLMDDAAALKGSGFQIDTVTGLQEDVDGVELNLIPNDASVSARTLTSSVQKMANSLADKFPVDVKISVAGEEEATIPAAGRNSDSAPFYAGGVMSSSAGMCSSGFAMKYSGVNRITTARHCNKSYKTLNGKSYGSTVKTNHAGQARILSGTGAGRTWDGAWNNSTGFNKRVTGYRDVSLGDFVCTNGANSGVHCNVKVTAMKVAFDDGYGGGAANNIKAVQQSSKNIAAIQGDSGGPVIYPNGTGTVGAVGMIQAISGTALTGSACGSVRSLGKNKCSKTVLFTSTRTFANSAGASLVTG